MPISYHFSYGYRSEDPMKRLLLFVCLAWFWTLPSSPAAHSPAMQPAAGQTTAGQGLVIANARIITGNGGVIERGSVVVRDGKIVSVSAEAASVPGAQVIDAQGKTVMPGFIDGHRHIIQGDAAQWLSEQASTRMQAFLDAGFTTVLSCGDPEEHILELRRRLTDGAIKGPRLFAAGRAPLARAAAPAGRGGAPAGDPARFDVSRPPLRPTQAAMAIPPEETRARVEAIKKAGFDAVKTAIIVTPGGPEQQTLSLIAQESKRLGMPSITHAVTVQDTVAAVEAGTSVLVHTPHIGQLTEAQAQIIAKAGMPMMSTLAIFVPYFHADGENNEPLFRDLLPFPWDTISSAGQGPVNARMLWNAGITYGYGTDTRHPPKDALAHELKPLRLVFSAKDIVSILTKNAAVTIGRSHELGTLEPGKIADLVMLNGDPLAEISNVLDVALVVKAGQIVSNKQRR